MSSDYPAFCKIPRLNKDVWITEKIDGTNGLVQVTPFDMNDTTPGGVYVETEDALWIVRAGSRNRWLTKSADNHQFAAWVEAHASELVALGPGHHYGEWYGQGIQRGYGLSDKRFALFNTARWASAADRPECCHVVPVLTTTTGAYMSQEVRTALESLRVFGSCAAPGFANPEGVVVYHAAAGQYFKASCEGDDVPKSALVLRQMGRAA